MKTYNDVRGKKINCINYIMCPMCYGCRNYNSQDPDCLICARNKKHNICNTEKHEHNLISKMITKTQIKTKEKICFDNFK